jgi:hypothetical protein
MKWSDWLENWGMTSLKVKTPFLEMDFKPQDADRDAAWEMYIELLTRITTQSLPQGHGDEATALTSVFKLFDITRTIIKHNKRHCVEFTKIAIVVLNQCIRPFTAKWHKRSLAGDFANPEACTEFRKELAELQIVLQKYTRMLGDMAGMEEDLTDLEAE